MARGVKSLAELSGRELLHEWQKVTDAVATSATSLAGRAEVPRQLLELIERERRLQAELTSRVLAPVDALFDLLSESGATLRRQAEALEAGGRALEQTAALMKSQAELFEETVARLRQPTDLAKAAAGVESKPRKRPARGTR